MSPDPQVQQCVSANSTKRLLRSNSVVSRQIAGETLVVPIRGKVGDLASIYSFNETGSTLWIALENPKSLDTLTHLLCQTYDVTWDAAERDATAFVTEMGAAGLLSEVQG